MLSVWRAFKQVADEDWLKVWESKKSRKTEHGDAEHRFLVNLHVLQRTRDFGRRLLDVGRKIMRTKGAVIDLRHDGKGGLEVMLNTKSAKPMKPGRAPKVAPKPTKRPRKPQDARKGRSKGKKAAPALEQPQDRPELPTE